MRLRVRQARETVTDGCSDDLAVGARQAATTVPNAEHARMFAQAKYFGIGAVPGFGRGKVDDGTLYASIVALPNAGTAIELLHLYWTSGRQLPLRTFSDVVPYPRSRDGRSSSPGVTPVKLPPARV